MRYWKWLVIVAVVAVLGVVFAQQLVIRNVVQTLLAEHAGAEVEIGEIDVDIWRSAVSLSDIQFRNPEGFPEETAVVIDRLDVTYRFFSLFTRTVRLPDVMLDVARVVVVTNEEGQNNFQHLLLDSERGEDIAAEEGVAIEEDDAAAEEMASRERARARPKRSTEIERLVLRLGEVNMRDYSDGRPEPVKRDYRLNLERTFTDVQDFEEIAQAVGTDLAMMVGPQLLRDLVEDSGVRTEDIVETITEHDGDLDELGRKLDEQTKDLQRELRRQFRSMRDRAE